MPCVIIDGVAYHFSTTTERILQHSSGGSLHSLTIEPVLKSLHGDHQTLPDVNSGKTRLVCQFVGGGDRNAQESSHLGDRDGEFILGGDGILLGEIHFHILIILSILTAHQLWMCGFFCFRSDVPLPAALQFGERCE
jgi:hypothetical protein